MKIMRLFFMLLTLFTALLESENSFASDPARVWIDIGVKGAVGGNYLSKPDDQINGLVTPFYDGAGGIGGGGGLFSELRVLKEHLSLEVDLLLEGNKVWCTITHSGVVDVDYSFNALNMRIPFLIKGNLVKNSTRISLGVGPEFIVGLNASPGVEITDGEEYLTAEDQNSLENAVTAAKRNDVALAWELAMAFAVKKISITVDMRFSYNLTLPNNFDERVDLAADYRSAAVQAGHTIDGRILLGVAYIFALGR